MLIFKCGIVVISSTYVLSLCFQVAKNTNSLDIGLAVLYIASVVIAGKIIFDRYQQIHILGALTPNPSVTAYANRIATCAASFLYLGFLVYFLLFIFKVDEQCLTALSIFICGFSTLYIWVQCIITTYVSTLFYDEQVAKLRQCLANASFPVVIVMAVFGTLTYFLPRNTSGLYICFVITSLCSYIIAAIFCVYILSFEKDYQFFAGGLRSDYLLDDECSLDNDTEEGSLFGSREIISNAMVITGRIAQTKVS